MCLCKVRLCKIRFTIGKKWTATTTALPRAVSRAERYRDGKCNSIDINDVASSGKGTRERWQANGRWTRHPETSRRQP